MLGLKPLHPSRAIYAATLALTLLASPGSILHAQPASPAATEDEQDDDGSAFQPDGSLQAGETAALASDAVGADEGASPAAALDDGSYCGRQLGSWFYCERPSPPPKVQVRDPNALHARKAREIVELEAYQKALEEARQVAIWRPTSENVERYVRLQKVALDKSSLFSDLWRRAIWTNPDLDYTLQRPTTQIAKAEYDNERSSDRDLFLRSVSDQVGMFYVYSGTCGPCRVASPIIKSFSDRFGVGVKVISTDGAENPVFGRTLPDRGQLSSWGIDHKVTPALLLYQSPSHVSAQGVLRQTVVNVGDGRQVALRPCTQARGCLTYLGAGVMSVEDIAERSFILLSKEPGSDY